MKQRTKRRLIAFLMVFALVVTTVLTDVPFLSSAEGEGTVEIQDIELLINDKVPTEDTKIKNDDKVDISFDWVLDNTDKTSTEFVVNITPLVGIKLENIGETALFADSVHVGQVRVDGGKLYITITNEEFRLKSSERKGGGTISGVVSVEGNPENGTKQTLNIWNCTKEFEYYDPANEPSTLTIQKSQDYSDGSISFDSDAKKWYRTFYIDVNTTGEVSDIKITDTPGAGLGAISNVEVTSSSDEDIVVKTYSSFDEIFTGKSLDGSVRIKYTMEVSADIFDNNTVASDYTNSVKASYKNNKDAVVETPTSSQTIYITKPQAEKTGVISDDNKKVTWTLKFIMNDYGKSGLDFATAIKEVIDKPGKGFEGFGSEIDVTSLEWKETKAGSGVWVATYETKVEAAYQNTAGSVELSNTVTFKTQDDETYTATGKVGTNPAEWEFAKDFAEYDAENKTLTWTVTATDIPSGLKNVSISDDPRHYSTNNGYQVGEQELIQTIYIKKKDADDDTYICLVENGAVAAGATEIVDSFSYWGGIKFKDGVFEEAGVLGRNVTLKYQTKIKDDDPSMHEYKNTATMSYSFGEFSDSVSDDAYYQVEADNQDKSLEKYGTVKTAGESIQYDLRINLNYLSNLNAGENITITDVLPTGMEYVEGTTATYYLHDLYGNRWTLEQERTKADGDPAFDAIADVASVTPAIDVTSGSQVATFTIPVNDNLIAFVEAAKASSQTRTAYLYLTYVAKISDLEAFATAGTTTYTNTATGEYKGETMGEVSVSQQLTPSPIVDKNGSYPVVVEKTTSTGIDYDEYMAKYVIKVNPAGLDLSVGRLTAIDTLGSALSYDLTSIVVKNTKTGLELEQGIGADQYSVSFNYSENSLVFSLPDSTPLEITYYAYVNLNKDDQLTAANSTNDFRLEGYSSDVTQDEVYFTNGVEKSKFWAESETGAITIKKYWTNEGKMEALDGSSFDLYEATYNEATGQMELVMPAVKTGMTVNTNGQYLISGLSFDQIYALKETTAKNGFMVNEEPYYFVLEGSSGVTLPSGIDIRTFVSGSAIDYENYKAGTLVITKTLAGDATKEEAEGLLQFKVTSLDTAEVLGTYILKDDFVYDAASKTWTKELDVKVGRYQVEEVVYNIDGYVLDSTTYTIDNSDVVNTGKIANVSVVVDSTTTVAYEDKYTKTGEEVTLSLYLYKRDMAGKTLGGIDFWIYEGDTCIETLVSKADGAVLSDYTDWKTGVVYTLKEIPKYNKYETMPDVTFEFLNSGTIRLISAPDTVEIVDNEDTHALNQIQVVNEYKLVSVSGTKFWEDDDNRDGLRPDTITVKLQQYNTTRNVWEDMVPNQTKVASKDEVPAWSYTFTNLREYDDNDQLIQYRVVETYTPDGYTVSGGTEATNYDLTNTHENEKTSVTIEKKWADSDNQDGIRPDLITVHLYADGIEIGTRTISPADDWKITIEGLDKYKNGKLIEYTLTEDVISGYTTVIDASKPTQNDDVNILITNTHVSEVTSVEVTKEWVYTDGTSTDNNPPDKVIFELYADGVSQGPKEVDASSSWKALWENLPVYKNGGQKITYTVLESKVADYTTTYGTLVDGKMTVTNTYSPDYTSMTVTKVWDDGDDQDGVRPPSLKVTLYKDGEKADTGEQPNPATLSDANTWTYTWTKLIADGTYTVEEELDTTPTDPTDDYYVQTSKDETGTSTIITNSHTPAVTQVNVKKVWVNDVAYGSAVTLSALNNWTHAWNNLPMKSAGTDLVYTVQEVNTPSGYTSLQAISGVAVTTITNKLVTETDEPDEPTTAEETTAEETTAEETTEEESEEETTEEESEDETTEEEETEEDSDMDGDSEDDGDVETDDDGPAPNTGDKAMPFAMALLMVLSVLGIVALTVFGRKRKM